MLPQLLLVLIPLRRGARPCGFRDVCGFSPGLCGWFLVRCGGRCHARYPFSPHKPMLSEIGCYRRVFSRKISLCKMIIELLAIDESFSSTGAISRYGEAEAISMELAAKSAVHLLPSSNGCARAKSINSEMARFSTVLPGRARRLHTASSCLVFNAGGSWRP